VVYGPKFANQDLTAGTVSSFIHAQSIFCMTVFQEKPGSDTGGINGSRKFSLFRVLFVEHDAGAESGTVNV